MAPGIIVLGGSGGAVLRAQAGVVRNALARRQETHMQWSIADQMELAKVVDPGGQFNGTCTNGSDLAPQPEAGECASYYADVTLYCCGAVGGSILQLTQQGGDANRDGTVEGNSTTVEPACQTTNFNDMLLCYKYTAEEHCRSAVSGPWGVCNMAEPATTQEANGASASNSTTSSAQKMSPSSSGSSGTANAARHGRAVDKQSLALSGTLLVTALLFVLSQASL